MSATGEIFLPCYWWTANHCALWTQQKKRLI